MKFSLTIAALFIAAAAQAAPFAQEGQSDSTSTTPHYLQRTIAISPGTSSGAIKIPAANVPVHMMVAVPTFGIRGIAEVTIMHVGPDNPFLAWVGLDAISNAISAVDGPVGKGTHIVYADASKFIDVQRDTAAAIRILNTGSRPATAVITFTW
jgi:hypothetical protein